MESSRGRNSALATVLVILGVVLTPAARAAVVPPASCTGFTVAEPGTTSGTMYQAVTTWGEGHAWVAGYSYADNPGDPQPSPAFRSWDGREWRDVPGRPADLRGGAVVQLSAAGPDDVWASGYGYDGSGQAVPQLLHVTGRTWVVQDLPAGLTRPGPVFAASPHDVWAAASTTTPDGQDWPVLLHRTRGWQPVTLPLPPGTRRAGVISISGSGPTDVWIGAWYDQSDPATPETAVRPLLGHWDGRALTVVPTADRPLDLAIDIAVAGRDTAWLLGEQVVDSTARHALQRWDGRTWSVVPGPPATYRLRVVTDRRGNARTLANIVDDGGYRLRVDHWDGRTWTELPIPAELLRETGGRAIATSASGRDTWLVADWPGVGWPPQYRSLILRSTCS